MDAPAIGEAEDMSGVALFVDKFVRMVASGGVVEMREALAVFEKEACLKIIPAGNPGIVALSGSRFATDQGASGGPSPANLARLLGKLEPGVVQEPAALVRQQKAMVWGVDFGAHI
jgi:hypothetical protein